MSDEILRDVLSKSRDERLQYTEYRNDPVGFGEEVLGYRYTDDVKAMMRSVLESPITLAKSANGTGKTFSAASLAVWWYSVFPDSKVFVTAAPPEQNLKNLLWGEINAVQRKHPELFADDKILELRIERHGEYYITGVTIPMTGTSEERQGKFCADAEDLFEMLDGSIVTYRSLIGKTVDVISVDDKFQRKTSRATFFDNGMDFVYEIVLKSGEKIYRTGEHPLFIETRGWTPVDELEFGDAVLSPGHGKDGLTWKIIESISLIGHKPTVGVCVPDYHTYLTSVVEHNSGKHAPYLLFIVDEGDAVPAEVYSGIEACMSGGFARLLVLFNPRGKRGPIYEMEASGRARVVHLSALRHPNVVTGEDIVPGAVSREATVRRINEWTRPVVSGEEPDSDKLFEVPDFLVGAVADNFQGNPYPPLPSGKRVITEMGFSYIVLGQYPAQGMGQLIEADWVDAAMNRWKEYQKVYGNTPPSGKARMGLDVAEFGPDFNVPILRYGDYVADIERIWQGVDTTQTAEFAIGICQRDNIDMVYVDGTGAGSGVAPYIARNIRGVMALSIKVAGKPSPVIKSELGDFFQLRDQLWWACREWLRTSKEAMLPPNMMLREELITPTYYIDPRGKIHIMDKDTMRERLKRSPNFADALILTFTPMERAKVRTLEGSYESQYSSPNSS